MARQTSTKFRFIRQYCVSIKKYSDANVSKTMIRNRNDARLYRQGEEKPK